MYGAACPEPVLTGTDFVTIEDMEIEASVLAHFIQAFLCHSEESAPG